MKIFLVISSLLIISIFFFYKEEPEVSDEIEIKLDKKVVVKKLQKESFTKTLKFSGFSEASRIVIIKSQVEGKVSSKSFEKGKFYKAGSQLVLIDPEDKIARLKEMEALLNQRKKEYEVAEKLFKKGFRSEVKLSESRTNFENALALYEKRQVELNNTKILIPFDSTIEDSFIELGDYVKKGDKIAKIVDLDPIFVKVNVTENVINNLRLNQTTSIIIADKYYEGLISYISKTSDPLTRNFRVEIKINNKQKQIISGLSSEVRIDLSKEDAYFIPSSLISLDDQGKIGIKVVQEKKVLFLTIDIISDTGNGYWVNSNSKNNLEERLEEVKDLDLGDIVCIEGILFRTKTDELTIEVKDFKLLTKSLNPMPEKHAGLTDIETIYRQRYVDLMSNKDSREVFVKRNKIVQSIRKNLEEAGFLEVETPMMHPIPGGANAKPFKTHHNALDKELFLRIAPELYLKRLLVGGFEKVFEINRNFRNEGL